MLPLRRRQRLGGSGALAIDFHERQTLAHTDQQTLRAFAASQNQLLATGLIQTQPGAESERASSVVLQRRTGRQQQRLAAELQGTPDHTINRRTGRALRGVAVSRSVLGRCASGAVEVVERGVIRVEGQLAVAGRRRLLIAVIHPDVLTLSALDIRHVDPDQRHAHQRVEAFDLMVEHGFVVGSDEAQVRAVLLHAVEGEVAGVQTHQQRRAAKRLIDRRALRRGVDGDLFAVMPVVLPPGLSRGREHEAQADQQGKNEALHEKCSWLESGLKVEVQARFLFRGVRPFE